MALDPIQQAASAAQLVEQRLILAIATGEKAAGERVTEAEIAKALQVSRVPVREAMQKLQVRGILVADGRRSLKVLDHSEKTVSELFKLRLAVERIVVADVMGLPDKSALIADLEAITAQMARLADSSDPVALSASDLDYHRTIARHSGNGLAERVWEGLAQHLQIVFCRDWSSDRRSLRMAEVAVHEAFTQFIAEGNIEDIDKMLWQHFFSVEKARSL